MDCVAGVGVAASMDRALAAQAVSWMREEDKAVSGIVKTMRTFPRDAGVQRKACLELAPLAEAASPVHRGLWTPVVGDVLAAMRAHPSAGDVQAAACWVLRFLSSDDDMADVLFQRGAAGDLALAMRLHAADARLQFSALGAVTELSTHELKCKNLVRPPLDFATLALAAIDAHGSDLNVELGLGCLANLLNGDSGPGALARARGAISMLVRKMRASAAAGVQREACALVVNIFYRWDHFSEQEVTLCAAFVLRAMRMRTYAADALLHEISCEALQNMAGGDPEWDVRALLVRLGAGSDIVACMRAFPGNAALQAAACGALQNLSLDAAVAAQLVELGADEDVLRVLRKHRAGGHLVEACQALGNLVKSKDNALASDSATSDSVASDSVASDSVASDAASKPATSATATTAATTSSTPKSMKTAERLMSRGAGGALLRAMRAELADARVQAEACVCLCKLASAGGSSVTTQLLHLNAGTDVILGLRAHTGEVYTQGRACGALHSLLSPLDSQASAGRDKQLEIVEEGVTKDVLDAMRRHSTDPMFVERALDVLLAICALDSRNAAQLLVGLSAGDELSSCIAAHPKSSAIKNKATQMLTCLQTYSN